jgi:malonate-semialdehyde dehydrogenase (acetylating)/methylmalonate-semialdehyde dehydrogenase
MTQITHWINGALDTKKPQRSGEVFNPATGKVTKTVAFADAATVDGAVNAATEAFATWRNSSLTKRTQVLFAFRELVQQNKEKIAALITDEHGKV